MYAVLKQGGKQYTVKAGEVISIEKLEGNPGDKINFEEVLLVNDGENIKIGEPIVEGVPVTGEIVSQYKGKKILIVKKKRRKGYRRINGHRQQYTDVKILAIGEGGEA